MTSKKYIRSFKTHLFVENARAVSIAGKQAYDLYTNRPSQNNISDVIHKLEILVSYLEQIKGSKWYNNYDQKDGPEVIEILYNGIKDILYNPKVYLSKYQPKHKPYKRKVFR